MQSTDESTARPATASAYAALGVSAKKEDVHAAIADVDAGLFPSAFCKIGEDVLGGDPEWCSILHADDAGTKAIVAYLVYRSTGDASVFRGIAQDALVMNLDDLLCVGAVDRFLLSNTINRNSRCVPGEVVREIVGGFEDCIQRWAPYGIRIVATGGETADMNDSVRTLIVGANLATRMRRADVVDNGRIQPGDVIVGLSSTGQANYEDAPNSGIGDNGLTLARHALLNEAYRDRYPETVAPELDRRVAYRGGFNLKAEPEGLGMSIGQALLSPTRTYAPVIRAVLATMREAVHGIVHNTGGGQTKCLRFGAGIAYRKDNLFPAPAIFRLIAEHGDVEWREMHQTFNLGHRMELYVPPDHAGAIVEIARQFAIDARVVGRCEPAAENVVHIQSEFGSFEYR